MNIALITITRNDDCRFREWVNHYKEYKDELYLHLIVDNDSTPEYQDLLRKTFPDSIIIELGYNGGCTSAYNAGIKYALSNKKVDAISLLGNDIRMPKGEITKLYDFLFSNDNYGMVFPIVLRPIIGNDRVNSFGNAIDRKTMRMIDQNHKMLISSLPDMLICETGPGGCNMSKPFFYEKVGLQDEKMFMYSDEVEMGIRAKKVGVTMAITKNAVAWHMHINQKGKTNRSTFTPFLIARNKIYVAKKHFGRKEIFTTLCFWSKIAVIGMVSSIIHSKGIDSIIYSFNYLKGLWAGITNNMKNNF